MSDRPEFATGLASSPSSPPRLSLQRLATVGGIVLLAAGTGGSLLCPFRVGLRNAAELVALEDRTESLRQEKARLQEELKYRQTSGGKALEASKQFEVGEPGGRVVELVPKAVAPQPKPRPTLSERADAAEQQARLALYGRWRVLARYLFDRRLPPPGPV